MFASIPVGFEMDLIDGVPFWSDDNGYPPLDSDYLLIVEKALGRKLPGAYVDLLRERNGGESNRFVSTRTDSESIRAEGFPVSRIWGVYPTDDLNAGGGEVFGLLNMPYMHREWGIDTGILFFAGVVGGALYFDYRGGPNPTIGWYVVDSMEVVVAKDFETWLREIKHESWEDWWERDDHS